MDELIPKKVNGQSGDDGNNFLRTEKLYVQVNAKELATIRANAKSNGYRTTAQFVRQSALTSATADNPVQLKHHYLECQAQLARIGNNLNQIARYVNQSKSIDHSVLSSLQALQRTSFEMLVASHRKVTGNS